MSVEPAPKINTLSNTQWHRPEYTLPAPSLKFLFHLECDMDSFRHVGTGPHGDRSTVIFKGGRFEGPDMRGKILPGGGGEFLIGQDICRQADLFYRLGDHPESRRRPADRSSRHAI